MTSRSVIQDNKSNNTLREHIQIAIGILSGLAVLCLLLRIFIRLVSRRRLFLDDSFLIFGFVCLIGGTVILYKRLYMIYLEFSVLAGDPTASLLAFQQTDELFEQSKWQLAYLLFLWTSIFAVKWCYFAFFHPLLRAMWKWIIFYYWFAIIFSIISWLFLVVGEQTITCPYVGKAAGITLVIDQEERCSSLTTVLSEVLPRATSF